MPGVEIIGFYDPNDAIAEQVKSTYGLKRFTTEEELIDAVDAVDIVTPTQYHFDLCVKAIRRHKHVFVEKPMANTMEEAMEQIGRASCRERV